jgi:hypothetical protein
MIGRPPFVPCIAALALAGCAPPVMRASFREGLPLQRTAHAAAGVTLVTIDGGVGDVTVRPLPGDSIRIAVSLHSSDEKRLEETCIPRSRLETSRTDGTLAARVVQQTRNQCGQRWTVELPPQLAVNVRVGVGTIDVRGLAGGATLEVENVGDIRAEVEGGSVHAVSAKGDVSVATRDSAYASVELRASVGEVKLSMNGMEVDAPRPPGAGDRITLRGTGASRIVARAGVGDVTVRIR